MSARTDELLALAVNADSAPEALASLRDEIALIEQGTQAEAERANKAEARIKDLQDTNHKLFLRVTGEPPKEEEQTPDTPEGALANFLDKVKAKMEEGSEK